MSLVLCRITDALCTTALFFCAAGASDLAYETMYDDDEGMGTQTMPWFDPNYLAMKGHGDEEVKYMHNQKYWY